MSVVTLSGAGLCVEDIDAVANGKARVEAAAEVTARLVRARETLDRIAASGQSIYGLNTGLGANLGTAVDDPSGTFQNQLLHGRGASVGADLPVEHVRATMMARVAMLAVGGSGLSPHVFQALLALINARIRPAMPSLGSIGAGDLVLLSAIGRCLIGEGDADYRGERMAAANALSLAGLSPVALAPKDGLSLINASAASAGQGALAVVQALRVFDQAQQAAALTMAGLEANLAILDPRLQATRPAAGQEQAAEALRGLLWRTDRQSASTLQDPLSVRCVASVHGALLEAIGNARRQVEIELNSAGDNPIVLLNPDAVMSTGNFHTASLALAFETLGLAVAQAAAACAARFIQLTGVGRNGLQKYLSPVGGASAGFVPLQKTVVAILAAIRHKANPVMLDFLPVSEGVEDHATQTPLAIAKCAGMMALWQRLVGFELLAGAQAVDLRRRSVFTPAIGAIHAAVREVAPPLAQDRPLGRDAEALYTLLSSGKWQA